jgi:hypothetical protein
VVRVRLGLGLVLEVRCREFIILINSDVFNNSHSSTFEFTE